MTPTIKHHCNRCNTVVWTHRNCDKTIHLPQLKTRPDLPYCEGSLVFDGEFNQKEAEALGATIASASREVYANA